MVRWIIILLACFGLFCGLRFFYPRAGEVAGWVGGYPITWVMIGIGAVIFLGAKLKSA